jgi:hypothetical protein
MNELKHKTRLERDMAIPKKWVRLKEQANNSKQ